MRHLRNGCRVGANALPITAADLVLGILFAVSFVTTATSLADGAQMNPNRHLVAAR
jgi:hypothetical protein